MPTPDALLNALVTMLVTIDPPGSKDLDQAVHVAQSGKGYAVRYAIADLGAQLEALLNAYPFLDRGHARRLMRNYGTMAGRVLGGARSEQDLGTHFGADLYAAEVDYLMRREWAWRAEDVIWRRTKLGLRLGAAQAASLAAYMTQARETLVQEDGEG
jgi:glycerol-3-phosphate dehydrogenase